MKLSHTHAATTQAGMSSCKGSRGQITHHELGESLRECPQGMLWESHHKSGRQEGPSSQPKSLAHGEQGAGRRSYLHQEWGKAVSS